MKTLALLGLTLLSACAHDSPQLAPLGGIHLPAPDSALTKPCERPVTIPAGTTSADIDPLWARDREAEASCAEQKAALVALLAATRKALAGP